MLDFTLVLSVGAILAGAPMILSPNRARQSSEAAWRRRVSELEAGAEESFHEEQRALKAYPPLSSNAKKRAFGLLLVVLGGAAIVLSLFG